MSRTTIPLNITANGSYLLLSGDDIDLNGIVTLSQTGTGTWKLQLSPNNGTTKFDLKTDAGEILTGTGNAVASVNLGRGSRQKPLQVYVTVTNAAGLSLDATFFGE